MIIKRKPVRAYDKDQVRETCMQHLKEQLQYHQPSLIVCLGNVAVQSFFQNPDIDVKALRGNWHEVNGYQTTAAYHPLAAKRRPNLYPLLVEDLRLAAKENQK
ncbi:uracil-DNA glycosylase family protein [Bacillus sp. SD088]|uniref:uracil-DNA glycosylase family protein n=1 Tax=Bacillus sp. SD088 TaxID=2782012 RepID=UPI001F60A758|nr:uracil-DNA glycosylase family protein [Bacillus sp. SD088]